MSRRHPDRPAGAMGRPERAVAPSEPLFAESTDRVEVYWRAYERESAPLRASSVSPRWFSRDGSIGPEDGKGNG